jgi:hypothetical protein
MNFGELDSVRFRLGADERLLVGTSEFEFDRNTHKDFYVT